MGPVSSVAENAGRHGAPDLEYSSRLESFRVTYCDFESGKHVAADGPLSLSKQEILALMDEVLTSAGSFVSVMDADGTMLQFVLDEDGSVMLDIPHPSKRGSYAMKASLSFCEQAIRDLDEKVTIDAFEGLEFERW